MRSLYCCQKVTFNWIWEETPDDSLKKFCIELEYRLRPRITRFLMDRLDSELLEDFSSFHFDVDMGRREIRISDKTPVEYASVIACDFMKEIGMNCC